MKTRAELLAQFRHDLPSDEHPLAHLGEILPTFRSVDDPERLARAERAERRSHWPTARFARWLRVVIDGTRGMFAWWLEGIT